MIKHIKKPLINLLLLISIAGLAGCGSTSPRDNLAEVYGAALDSYMPLDPGLNHDIEFIAIDTGTLAGATENDKQQILKLFEKYNVEVKDASLKDLKEQGLFDEEKMGIKGLLLTVKNIDFKLGGRVVIEGSKYRSGTGAIGVKSTVIYDKVEWQVKDSKITWIS